MNSHKSLLFALLGLVSLQALCFGPIIAHVGFYLDDWIALCLLHFAPKDGGYLGLLHYYLFSDSRVLIRPLEALHFVTVYSLCADKPLLWHIVNFFFETLSAFVFYVVLLRLTGRRAAAFCGALLLLLYPSHDATHYWVVCSSVALSLFLYLLSFWANLKVTDLYLTGDQSRDLAGEQSAGQFRSQFRGWKLQLLSFVFFLLSLLNYETFLPLAALSVLASLAVAYRTTGQFKKAIVCALLTALPLILAAVALLIYLKVIVPMLGHGYSHSLKLDLSVMLSTIGRGLAINAPPEALHFFGSQAQAGAAALTSSQTIRLLALLAVATLTVIYMTRVDKSEPLQAGEHALLKPVDLLLLGLFTIFMSYTIFGLSPDYMPTYTTIFNRINTGASLGVALVIVAMCKALEMGCLSRRIAYVALLALGTAASMLLFTLADWGLSKPWIASWTTQKRVRQSISQIPGKLDNDASLLLINCPRYVMWSPVFDGVWDFQSMARMTLERPAFKANVVSERLTLSPEAIKDISYGYECGSYPFDKLYLMVAPYPELIPVRTPAEFIDTVGRRGMTFGLDKKMLSKWKEEAAQKPKLERSH